jgi:hypothetical protein
MPRVSIPQRSVARRINPSEVNALLQRGNALKATGDLAGARLSFGRAVEAGDARAAFSYAETYDPIVLEKLGEVGLASNVAIARTWYGKAGDRGSSEALERLERLADVPANRRGKPVVPPGCAPVTESVLCQATIFLRALHPRILVISQGPWIKSCFFAMSTWLPKIGSRRVSCEGT